MASGYSGLLLTMPDRMYLQVRSEYTEMLGGDHKSAIILFALGFRANLAVMDRPKNSPIPDQVTFSVGWRTLLDDVLDGMFSPDTVSHRLKYLRINGFIDFQLNTGGEQRTYVLNVGFVNRSILERKTVPAPLDGKTVPARTENRASQNGKPCQEDVPPIYINKLGNTSSKDQESGSLSEPLPSEEKQEEPVCPTLDNSDLDLDSPIEEFARNSIRNIARVKPPNLKTRATEHTVNLLRVEEERNGPISFRRALDNWCRDDNPWLRENKFPLHHFLKKYPSYLPVDHEPRDRYSPPRRAVAGLPPAPISLHAPLGESPRRVTPADMVETWNRIVTTKPFTGANPEGVFDPDFTASTWQKVCETANAIIGAKGKEASWLTLRWALRSDPAKGQNWRRLAEGEMDFMTTGAAAAKPMTKGQKDSAMADRYLEKLRAKAAAKKAQENTNAVD